MECERIDSYSCNANVDRVTLLGLYKIYIAND